MPKAQDVICVLQARMASTRLPGKAVLPLGGIPCAVLCAKRIANTGLEVIVAIGDGPEDDSLAELVDDAGMALFRGDALNVLARFLAALSNYKDDSTVVRLTADNPVVDGHFVKSLLRGYEASKTDYFGTRPHFDDFPYGLAAEAFRLGELRKFSDSDDTHLREHVTSGLRDMNRPFMRATADQKKYAHLRCTLDSIGDYQRLFKIFRQSTNPIEEPWLNLCDMLLRLPDSPKFGLPSLEHSGRRFSRMALGTVQLGIPSYGTSMRRGCPSDQEARNLVMCALDHGVTGIDTAYAYGKGKAERKIGRALGVSHRDRAFVTTKLPAETPPPDSDVGLWTELAVIRSVHNLRTDCLDCLLLHRWEHRHIAGGAIWDKLRQLKSQGLISVLGASVQNPVEALEAINDPEVGIIQLPINLLDGRWSYGEFQDALENRPDLFVQGRSILLQGILLSPAEQWPRVPGLDPTKTINKLHGLTLRYKRENVLDLCLAFALGLPWIHQVVIGTDETRQLQENVRLALHTPLSPDECNEIREELGQFPSALLDPSRWEKSST